MDPHDGWRLRPVAEPVSYYDTGTGQWTSGSFETALKSEHPAVVTSSDTTAAASSAFAAAAQHGSASTPAHDPWNGMHRTSGPMPTPPSRQQKWLNAVAWADAANADVGAGEALQGRRDLTLPAAAPPSWAPRARRSGARGSRSRRRRWPRARLWVERNRNLKFQGLKFHEIS